ncbi:MAG: hypothetical protein Q8O13_01095 [Candidatus Omnitrophota bacterium]|nr:hypothetical protein [Candidatus Omnitrophota bacterium]
MSEEIKELIEKIQQEGVKQAEEKAGQIEAKSKQQAEQIIVQARNEAEKILEQAKEKVEKLEQASKTCLTQAGRDLLINLRKEINGCLDKIMVLSIREALNPEALAKILHSLINETAKHNKSNIIISLSKDDFEKIGEGFLSELKEELKKGITLQPSEDISAGFLISFDAGKSCFDFTGKALAEYIGQYIRPDLAKLLKE